MSGCHDLCSERERGPEPARRGRSQTGPEGPSEALLRTGTRHPVETWGAIARADTATRASAVSGLQPHVGNRGVQRLAASAAARTGPVDDGVSEGITSALGRGTPLDGGLRERLESGLRADLGNVRIHLDGEADRMARAVGARAFTTGDDVFFRSGVYDPTSAEGLRTLAHEAAHTVQQAAGPVDGTDVAGSGLAVSSPGDRFERAADEAGEAVVQGRPARHLEPAPPAGTGGGGGGGRRTTVQRQEGPTELPPGNPDPTYSAQPRVDIANRRAELEAQGQVGPLSGGIRTGYQLGGHPFLDAVAQAKLGDVNAGASFSTERGAGVGGVYNTGDINVGATGQYVPGQGFGAGFGASYQTPDFTTGAGVLFPPGGSPTAGAAAVWSPDRYRFGVGGSVGANTGASIFGEGPVPGNLPLDPYWHLRAGVGQGGAAPNLGTVPGSGASLPSVPNMAGPGQGSQVFGGVSLQTPAGRVGAGVDQNLNPSLWMGGTF